MDTLKPEYNVNDLPVSQTNHFGIDKEVLLILDENPSETIPRQIEYLPELASS